MDYEFGTKVSKNLEENRYYYKLFMTIKREEKGNKRWWENLISLKQFIRDIGS
jgi:hypothetical protein